MTGNERFDTILQFLGAMVPLMSAIASYINHVVRTKQAAGTEVSPVLLHAGAVLNVASINVDKAVQLAKMARESVAAPAEPEKPEPSP